MPLVELVCRRRYDTRAIALAEATAVRGVLEADGWICGWCLGSRWICDAHPDRPYRHDGCGGHGNACPGCNPGSPPLPSPDTTSFVTRSGS